MWGESTICAPMAFVASPLLRLAPPKASRCRISPRHGPVVCSASKPSRFRLPIALATAGAAALVAISFSPEKAIPFAEKPGPPPLTATESSVIALFQKAAQSVVNVTTYSDISGGFSMNQEEVPVGAGSGIVWDKDGHVVTNL